MKHIKGINDFKDCEYFSVGDKVRLSPLSAPKWKFGNTNTPQYKVDGLDFDSEYTISSITPTMKVVGGDQQFVSVDSYDGTYPCWCFNKI